MAADLRGVDRPRDQAAVAMLNDGLRPLRTPKEGDERVRAVLQTGRYTLKLGILEWMPLGRRHR